MVQLDLLKTSLLVGLLSTACAVPLQFVRRPDSSSIAGVKSVVISTTLVGTLLNGRPQQCSEPTGDAADPHECPQAEPTWPEIKSQQFAKLNGTIVAQLNAAGIRVGGDSKGSEIAIRVNVESVTTAEPGRVVRKKVHRAGRTRMRNITEGKRSAEIRARITIVDVNAAGPPLYEFVGVSDDAGTLAEQIAQFVIGEVADG